jgi:hypothetical protein
MSLISHLHIENIYTTILVALFKLDIFANILWTSRSPRRRLMAGTSFHPVYTHFVHSPNKSTQFTRFLPLVYRLLAYTKKNVWEGAGKN